MEEKKDGFSSKFGFIASTVGAALGLGNIWMFSYKLGEYGGAAFLLPYFLFVFLFGTTGLMTEFAFGRRFHAGSFQGIQQVFKERNLRGGRIIGIIPSLGMMGIFMFYSVVIGWILKYFVISITGQITQIETTTYFDHFAGTSSTIPWLILAVCITLVVVMMGVSKGIEKLNKIIMPMLLIIFILLTIKSLSLPGSMEGVKYLLTPDWSHLLHAKTWVMALGQAFFTVSLTGCGMVVYGSYINEKFDIPSAALGTAILDTIAALLAAFMIMPAVFAFGLNPSAGPSLLFITVPKVFQEMPYGSLLSTIFFLSIIFAAISSSVNMLEGPVETLLSATKLSRKRAAILISCVTIVGALPLALNTAIFSSFTDIVTIIISPLGVLVVTIVFFYVYGIEKALIEINIGANIQIGRWFIPLGKYVFVFTIIVVILLGIYYGGIG